LVFWANVLDNSRQPQASKTMVFSLMMCVLVC
jgi:hypothetical protein